MPRVPSPRSPAPRRAFLLPSFAALVLAAVAAAAFPVPAQEPASGGTAATAAAPADVRELAARITEDGVGEDVRALADRSMRGRGTLTPDFERAASYVEAELAALGLQPAGDDGYRLHYPLPCVVPGDDAACVWFPPGADPVALTPEREFVPVPGSIAASAEGEPVLVGWAIEAKDERWDDVDRRDVRDRIVFAFTREPWADAQKGKRFDGPDSTRHSELVRKAQAVADGGGLALVLVPDPDLFPDEDELVPGLCPFVALGRIDARALEQRMGFPDLPVLCVSRAVASRVFDTDVAAWMRTREKRKRPDALFAPKGTRVGLTVDWKKEDRQTYDLVARIPGTDDSGEAVVVGAHLDHVGLGLVQDFGRARLDVYPGADDNASGAAALLNVAAAFAGVRPRRDLLFVWFSGEELGLLGSRAYCEDPAHPLERTVAMLNMDQIGRTRDKEANVGGTWDHPEWERFVSAQAKRIRSRLKLDFDGGRDVFARSDHYSFHRRGVPALFFFEGRIQENPVYHRPGDVPDTLDPEKTTRVARIVAACAWALAVEGEDLR